MQTNLKRSMIWVKKSYYRPRVFFFIWRYRGWWDYLSVDSVQYFPNIVSVSMSDHPIV